jgi:hypothetical protein
MAFVGSNPFVVGRCNTSNNEGFVGINATTDWVNIFKDIGKLLSKNYRDRQH